MVGNSLYIKWERAGFSYMAKDVNGMERSRTDNFTHYQCFYLCHSLCSSQHLFFSLTSELPPSPGTTATYRHSWYLEKLIFSLKCENLQGSELTLALDKSPDHEGPSHLQSVSPRVNIYPEETFTNCRWISTPGWNLDWASRGDGSMCQLRSSIRQEQEGHTALPELDPPPRNIWPPVTAWLHSLWGQGTINSFGNTQLE